MAPQINRIKEIVDEVIHWDDTHRLELQELVRNLFKGKTQQDIDALNQKTVQALKDSYDIILKEKLIPIDRMFLDYFFHGLSPINHYIKDWTGPISESVFKSFAKNVLLSAEFDTNTETQFLSFIGMVLLKDTYFDEFEAPNKDQTLWIQFSLNEFENMPHMDILLIGDIDQKETVEKILNF